MPRYYRESTYHRQVRFIKLARRLTLIVLIIIACVGLLIALDSWRASRQNAKSGIRSTETKSTYVANTEVYRTEYFQFQAGKKWRAVANESSAKKFVYRRFDESLLQAQLNIYVNEPTSKDIDVNRVLPVNFSASSNSLKAVFTSEHCAKGTNAKGYKTVSLQGVTFRCNTETTDYSVIVGKEGGDTMLQMIRPDGNKITYIVHYKDLRAVAVPQDLEDIINTFQTR